MAKVAANYMNSQLIKMEAITNGYSEGIALDASGYVSEGSGENIFLIRDGKIYTPTLGTSALPGITRDTVLTLCKECGFPVIEQAIPREFLYIADELFFTGTAAEITPIRSVDRIPIGSGGSGPITQRLQKEFTAIVTGKGADRHGWLTMVNAPERVSA
jgi:branched-chain amino acid aminotransferase